MNQALTLCLIGLAGALGALARHGTNTATKYYFGEGFPLGTLIVNVIGCFVLGLIAHLGQQQMPEHLKLILGVGLMGALTTFSTFGVDTVTKFNDGEIGLAFLNVFLNLALGFGAVWAGMTLAKSFSGAVAG